MDRRARGRPPATTHDEIRRVAMRLFAENGYRATSLAQIAEAAGVSRTTLFTYFPAKRDLVWEELHDALAALDRVFDEARDLPVVDAIAEAVCGIPRSVRLDRRALAERWSIVRSDDELRAHLVSEGIAVTDLVVDRARRRASPQDAVLVDHVVRALLAVVTRCIEEWSLGPVDDVDLVTYTRGQLDPFIAALRPLLS